MLDSLLDRWRACRHPRIADLIDVVSATVESTEAIAGKTVAERDANWRAIAKQQKATDLPRLLCAPWPKQWRDAQKFLELLNRWPDDPRLAAGLVRLAVEPPYRSTPSEAFYKALYRKIGKLADLRGLPALKSQTERESLWRESAIAAVAAIERRFPSGPPAIVDEAGLAAIEAAFSDRIATATADADRGATLLAAIYDAPDDDAPRAVYADWLTEHGDPRGEFITLQLAGANTPREHKLLDEYGRTWAGALGALFEPHTHVFDRGFFAGGRLMTLTDSRPANWSLDDPAWRLVRDLDCYGSPDVMLPIIDRCPALRSIGSSADTIAALTTRATPPAGLRVARIYSDVAIPWLVDSQILARIQRLALHGNCITRALVEVLLLRVRELELFNHYWRATIDRASSSCTLGYDDPDFRYWLVEGLVRALDVLPDNLALAIDPKHVLPPDVRPRIEPLLARFASATVKWHEQKQNDETAPTIHIIMYGLGLLDPTRVERVWQLLAEANQHYDEFVVGAGKVAKPLGDDPMARIMTWANSERTTALTLRHSLRADNVALAKHKNLARSKTYGEWTKITLVVRDGYAGIPAWLVRVCELAGRAADTHCRPTAWLDIKLDSYELRLSWLFGMRGNVLPLDELQALAATLPGMQVLPAGDDIVIAAAATPDETTPERLAAIRSGMHAIAISSRSSRGSSS